METILTNSNWNEKIETKIGNIGEQIIRNFFERNGYICYQPVTDGAHLLDFFFFKKNKGIIAADVKTKPSRNKYPDTGFNLKHYEAYNKFISEHNMMMFIFFVDPRKKEIYGNFLHELDKQRISNGMLYPLDEKTKFGTWIRYYPLEAMIHIADLSNYEVSALMNVKGSDFS